MVEVKVKRPRLFPTVFLYFLILGVLPILLVAILFSLPQHFSFLDYRILVGLLLILSTVSTLCLTGVSTRLLKGPINKLLEAQKKVAGGETTFQINMESAFSQEVFQLFDGFNRMSTAIAAAQEKEKEFLEQKFLAKVATQVVHDLNSPLSALNTVRDFFNALPTTDPDQAEVIELLNLSTKRFAAIADDLLKKHRKKDVLLGASSVALHQIIDELIGEYESQKKFANVHFVKDYQAVSIEVETQSTKLQRALGNVIKNAIEAMNARGSIVIKTILHDDKISLVVQDDGPGMSAETLAKVLCGGHSEKQEGHGIGVGLARDLASEWNGTFTLTSQVGSGTTAVFEFKLHTPFVQRQYAIQIHEGKNVIVVDDDVSLRKQWDVLLRRQGCRLRFFTSYEDLKNSQFMADAPDISLNTVIVDFNYAGSDKTGADVLRLLQNPALQPRGNATFYLCTSDYWKPSVKTIAKELNTVLYPKPLPLIEIKID